VPDKEAAPEPGRAASLGVSHLAVTARVSPGDTVWSVSHASDLTNEQWALLEPVFNAPGKRGPKHAPDLRSVVDAMLYVSRTGCQWRYLPESLGPWTRVWSQFRRWSRNGTWARALTVLHAARPQGRRSRRCDAVDGGDRHPPGPRGVQRRVHLPWPRRTPRPHQGRQARRGGRRDRALAGPGALVVPASTHENRASELMLEHLTRQAVTGRLELVLVDRGVTATAARTLGRLHDLELRRVGVGAG
jgi:putative transposase